MAQAGSPTLGIIGGAGVGAAAQLYVEVTARFRAQTGELPQIALWNLPLSDAILHAFLGGGADVAAVQAAAEELVAQGVERLVGAGATVVAMPCNSLQRAAARETERAGLPFIDMIDATAAAARAQGFGEAVLFATPATYAGGYYDGYGVDMSVPADEVRAQLSGFIARVIEAPAPGAGAELHELIERARRPGAAVVLGCTDICGLLEPSGAVVESLGCLAASCVEALGAVPVAVSGRGRRA
jgi:aspartate racemase